MKLKTNRQRVTSLNAISLTDIVFLLLIFFLLSSTFVLQPGIKVALPKTTSVEVSTEKSIVVTITADGSLFLNDQKVSRATLPGALRLKLRSVGRPIVVIRADRRVSLEQAVEVMDVSRQAGAEKFMIATREKE